MWSPRSFDEALTDKQTAFAETYMSENVSIMAELALGNEHFARELLDADASIVEKLLNRIAEVKEALARRKDAAAKEAFEEVRKAEKMFLDALAEKGMRFEKGKIIGANEEEDEVKKSKKGANRPIVEQDLETYLKIGKTKHTRDKKEGMMKQGKKPILTSVSEIQDFLSNVIHGKAGGEVRAFGFVGKRLANEVKKKRGSLDIQDHYLEIVADDLREAYIRHHQPKEKGDIALSEQDFLHIPQYLNDFDGIIDIVTHKNRTQIHIYKETEDGFIKILTVVSGERNALQVTKLTGSSKEKFLKKYKKTGRDTGSPGSSSFDEENSNFATRTRHTAGVLPNDSIHDSEPIVKTSDEISSEKSSKPVQKSRKTVTATPPEVDHLTPMQKQTVANYTRAKVYTKAEALAVVEDMAHFLDENYGFDGGLGEASGFVTLTKTVKDAQSLFSFLVKIHPNKKTNRNKKCVVKNKFPISENNIPKPIDKRPKKVYNDANETNRRPKQERPPHGG